MRYRIKFIISQLLPLERPRAILTSITVSCFRVLYAATGNRGRRNSGREISVVQLKELHSQLNLIRSIGIKLVLLLVVGPRLSPAGTAYLPGICQ